MTTTTITATSKILPHVAGGYATKAGWWTLLLPASWTAAGVALDLSDYFTNIFAVNFGVSDAITDHAYKFCGFGTASATGLSMGPTAATLTIGAHWANGGASPRVFDDVNDATNLSGISVLPIEVIGE
jgi:hypothetical protein